MIVYKTTNIITGKIYVGKDKNNNPKYLGSGKIFRQALHKYGIENFKKETLEFCDSIESLNKQEIYWIAKLNARDRNIGYNISSGGEFGDTITFNPNKALICEKISKANKGKKRTDETRKRLSVALMGHSVSDHVKDCVREARKASKGKCSDKTKNKLKNILKNRCSGENNINAKIFYLISPNNIEYTVKGGLLRFCKEHAINVNVVRAYVNLGKIPTTIKKNNEIRQNTVGWEIKSHKDE